MIELRILELRTGNQVGSLGDWNFLVVPRVGEHVRVANQSPDTDTFEVIAVEHAPVKPDRQRAASARPDPTIQVFVRYLTDDADLRESVAWDAADEIPA